MRNKRSRYDLQSMLSTAGKLSCRRTTDVHTCTVPRTQSRLRDRSFGVAGPRLWNNLPTELRQQDICLTEFRQLLKDVFVCCDSAHCDFFVLMAPGISALTYLLT